MNGIFLCLMFLLQFSARLPSFIYITVSLYCITSLIVLYFDIATQKVCYFEECVSFSILFMLVEALSVNSVGLRCEDLREVMTESPGHACFGCCVVISSESSFARNMGSIDVSMDCDRAFPQQNRVQVYQLPLVLSALAVLSVLPVCSTTPSRRLNICNKYVEQKNSELCPNNFL